MVDIQGGDTGWTYRVEIQVDIQGGDTGWTYRVEIQGGHRGWRYRVEIHGCETMIHTDHKVYRILFSVLFRSVPQ